MPLYITPYDIDVNNFYFYFVILLTLGFIRGRNKHISNGAYKANQPKRRHHEINSRPQ